MMVLATLLFVGIVTPTKIMDREDLVPNHFLDIALQKLFYLDGLVTQYCANLGQTGVLPIQLEMTEYLLRR
jgi:hypothetical protein